MSADVRACGVSLAGPALAGPCLALPGTHWPMSGKGRETQRKGQEFNTAPHVRTVTLTQPAWPARVANPVIGGIKGQSREAEVKGQDVAGSGPRTKERSLFFCVCCPISSCIYHWIGKGLESKRERKKEDLREIITTHNRCQAEGCRGWSAWRLQRFS